MTQDGDTRDKVKHKDGVSDRVASKLTNMDFGLHFYHPFAKNDKLVIRGKVMEEHRAGGTMTDNLFLNPFSEGTEDITTNRMSADLNYNLPIGKRSELNFSTAYVHHKRNATNDTFLGDYIDSHNGASPDVQMMRPYVAKENTYTPSLTFTTHLSNHTLLAGTQGYFTNLSNKIEFVPADEKVKKLGYTYQWQNQDDAYVQGIELGVKWNPFKDFKTALGWTFNQGKYKHVRGDWADTPYAEASKNISRFPAMTGDINLEYTPGTWTFTVNGTLQGKMYIDYMKDDEVAEKIKETSTYMLFNARVAKQIGAWSIYAGGKNLFSYVQDEKHTDNAAFMYAPVYGATWYVGVGVKL